MLAWNSVVEDGLQRLVLQVSANIPRLTLWLLLFPNEGMARVFSDISPHRIQPSGSQATMIVVCILALSPLKKVSPF